jgi:8-amino-7-oxononanoate synthase
MGTLGKALGSSGGYICGSHVLIDLLINRARSFIFSTAPPPATAAAARAAIRIVQSRTGQLLIDRLWKRVHEVRQGLTRIGIKAPGGRSAILPLIIGREKDALNAALGLRKQGIYIPAIRFPTVARNQARLRLTLSAAHTSDDIRQLLSALAALSPLPWD